LGSRLTCRIAAITNPSFQSQSNFTGVRLILEGPTAQPVPDWVSKDSRVSTI
jgi:hypothetical protein